MSSPVTASVPFDEMTFTPDGKDYTLDNPMLTEAVKVLLARIEALEAELKTLKGAIK